MYTIKSGNTTLEILKTGDIHKHITHNIMINQFVGTCIEEMASNIYLRVYDDSTHATLQDGKVGTKPEMGAIKAYPLIGRHASNFTILENGVVYTGKVEGIDYIVRISLSDYAWFYDVTLVSNDKKCVDIVYTKDLGLASEGHVSNNEAYNSQYIDHSAFDTAEGYVICSRQNQMQMGGFPFLQQGLLSGGANQEHSSCVKSFSVDGFPFFGLEYKFDNKICGLSSAELDNRIYQYDFAYSALQVEPVEFSDRAHFTFYNYFKPNVAAPVNSAVKIDEIWDIYNEIAPEELDFDKLHAVEVSGDINLSKTVQSAPLLDSEIARLYPSRNHEEYEGGQLLSFFTPTSEHVVLMEKERHVERAHGHILINISDMPCDVMTSTNYVYGVFSSHVAIGNTSFNKLDTNCRNGLNVQKSTGQRLMVKLGSDGEYRLLTMPAAYELGFNYSKWLYKVDGDIIEVRTYIGTLAKTLKLEVLSHEGKEYEFLLLNTLQHGVDFESASNKVHAAYNANTMTAEKYPDLKFEIVPNVPFEIHADASKIESNLVALKIASQSNFTVTTYATLDGEFDYDDIIFEPERELYRTTLKNAINNFKLSGVAGVDKFNDLAMWYSHNARVHYSSPHGLEQFTGAAWGTRDVCQGPFEYFLVTQNYDICRYILETVYKHQYIENGNWPQWFMFDEYRNIQHHESHGDIIVWPIKALAAYLDATGDYSILESEIQYTNISGYNFTAETEPLIAHVERQVKFIEADFIAGTALSCYGGGDWDDTLQPARQELAQNMVSGWTVSLTYQAFSEFVRAVKGAGNIPKNISAKLNAVSDNLQSLTKRIKEDFNTHLVKDDIATGFLLFTDTEPEYLLHPRDNKTGLKYRLLPMIRGMISEMFTPKQADAHYKLIKEHLYHPDGVRLMDTTCAYRGGENLYFMRAETAASFAREVCLMYVHAHIRFVEAMAKTGRVDEAWSALEKINPIKIEDVVATAARRQSNVYFTSSEAAFENRYDAMENFHKIKSGEIKVKSGWRLYSSGPGIYLNQLISNVLGLRIRQEFLVIDPVLPQSLDGLVFEYAILGNDITIKYVVSGAGRVSKVIVDGKEAEFVIESQQYRLGGAIIPIQALNGKRCIEVYC